MTSKARASKPATRLEKRNSVFFGIGSFGRDFAYNLTTMYLMYYLTEILQVSDAMLAGATAVIAGMRFWDGFNDPIMGMIIDNTSTRWGKFKPWLLGGGLLRAVLMVLMFSNFNTGRAWTIAFFFIYFLWEMAYTADDIAYFGMLPAISRDQKVREKAGTLARLFGAVGTYLNVVMILPVTQWLTGLTGSAVVSWQVYAVFASIIQILFESFTLFGVHEDRSGLKKQKRTGLRELIRAVFGNDQLLWIVVAMSLFNSGYFTTIGFGVHYFKYVFGNEAMYPVFAVILGVTQIVSMSVFPKLSERFSRTQLFTAAIVLMSAGYLLFYFGPNSMASVGPAGFLLFFGQAFVNLLMLVFITDTVEYGEWKLGQRNESVTLSLQPLVSKIGHAVSSAVMGWTLIRSGINAARTPADVLPEGRTLLKNQMMIIPMLLVILSYIIWRLTYRITPEFYQSILRDLDERNKA